MEERRRRGNAQVNGRLENGVTRGRDEVKGGVLKFGFSGVKEEVGEGERANLMKRMESGASREEGEVGDKWKWRR